MHRLNFTASVDVTELASRERFSLRMTDVGAGGCFLDALFPLPVGSKVRVTLRHGLMDFHAEGQVVYSQSGLGMGIAFDELNSEQRHSLMQLVQ